MMVVSFNMAYRSFRGGAGRLDTRLDTPPSINRRHPNSCLAHEPDQLRYGEAIEVATVRLVSAVTRVELAFVIEGRKREVGRERLERFFQLTGTDIVSVTPQQ